MTAPIEASTQFSNTAGVLRALKRAARHLVPPAPLKPSEWAEQNVRIPAGNAVPGPIRFDNAPYQREPMDMAAHPGCYRISLMWGAQVGKTQLALCVQGYSIAHEPRSQMMMQPSQGDLTTWLETKFNPMVDANPVLQRLLPKPRSHEGVNNQRMKSYPGGFMMFAWAGSTKTMRGRSAPLIVADEVDGYSGTDEGDEVELLWQRAATFGDQRLLLEISTPTIKGDSRIEAAFDQGDQRHFYVACPHCDQHQRLRWSHVQWDKDEEGHHLPETARYICDGCGALWNDGERIAAIRSAERVGAGWKANKPFRGHASYHLNELYSCFRRLRDIVQSFLDKKAKGDLQSFINVSLAETYEEQGEQHKASDLLARAEAFPAPVPMGGLYLTAGVDMQQDRLEVETVAWGLGQESWSVDYTVLWGDPLRDEVWQDLDDYLAETWLHESGAQMAIGASCLDTGGNKGYTQRAYEYVRRRSGRRLFAIKGVPGWDRPVVMAPSRKRTGRNQRRVDLFSVGVDEGKLTVMRRLALAEPGPGFCHFPKERDEEWYHQLTAEKLVTKYVKGVPKREWHQTRPRNEALDCRVYAYAALLIASPNLSKLAKRMERALENLATSSRERAGPPAKGQESSPETSDVVPTRQSDGEDDPQPRRIRKHSRGSRSRQRRGSGWVTKW
ncbi:phage terminase large subunit family protein [Halomonas sp. MMSF_3323]|uniref:phage terminase large subunit family protein n=1 Tax=Halomonas sp. MMSF_3323 TaxID=3046701 RepID=UPI00273EE9D0|nr:phage terminase large subunit family protein [Halomonas sp. MMSF_3323]